MTLRLHHLNASRSQRIVWLLEELGAEYELVRHERDAQTRLAPPGLLKIHGMGKAPLLEDGEVVVAETGAIAQYLLARHDPDHRLHPRAEELDFPDYLEWMHAAEGAVFLPSLIFVYLDATGLSDSFLAEYMSAERDKAMGVIEARLSEHDYFAGDRFTAADCLMGFQLDNADAAGALAKRPATKAWLERIRVRPAYQRMREIIDEAAAA
ncbi:glutathione S-transferase family protein [Marinicauda salina]|uniref:Glutathione S-transferase family protein n=1 Tax=Marinicauda salina TaxID=2135793 RepID=A0A2U2BY06_9PROT|nr:glutathione S-transferase family protein [Marinicauda salina]PWE18877.1 glutathione S-transferase family protein [Marinicauda salina]